MKYLSCLILIFTSFSLSADEEVFKMLEEKCKDGMKLACQTLECHKGNKDTCEKLKAAASATLKSMGMEDLDQVEAKIKKSGMDKRLKYLAKECKKGDKPKCKEAENIVKSLIEK